ncbi:MAG TPA: hypothetical protein VK563_01805 [Puia sp.]|nr:hypothetical protein [Puia sp.]
MLRILLYFLTQECTEGSPTYMKDVLPDLAAFFELLDLIDKEVDQSGLY